MDSPCSTSFVSARRGYDVMSRLKRFLILLSGILLSMKSASACEMSDFVGWTIVYSGTVTGYIDEDGEEHDDFEGCEYGRVLIVDYSRTVTCSEYNYSYAYHPDIAILSNGSSMKACIDDEMYNVSR